MEMTITAAGLAARFGEPGLLLVDVRDAAAYAAGTIPGAANLNVYDYFIPSSEPAGVADLTAAAWAGLSAVGAAAARTVVYFEQRTGMISPRGVWFHHYAGLDGGFVLDGGFDAWVAAGGATAPGAGLAAAVAPAAAAVPIRSRRALLATVEDVRQRAPGTVLLDTRRRSEHAGDFVHPCCARPGRIPGSHFLFWEDFLEDGHYRTPADIAARARAAGLTPEQPVITYCHRGARAATALYGLQRAGFAAQGAVFVGSWHEWAERADLPAERGA